MTNSTKTVAVASMLAVCVLAGCGKTPELSPKAYEMTKTLIAACNRKQKEKLPVFRQMVAESQSNDELSESEAELLNAVADRADGGDWSGAQRQARRMLEDQIQK